MLLIALTAALGCELQGPRASAPDPKRASVAQPSGLLDLEGRPFDLWADRSAKATVVLFTRSDCPISNRYAPEVRRLYERFQPQGARFLLVYVHPEESADAVRQHVAEYGYPCPAVRDPRHELVHQTGAEVTPEAAVFGADRQVVYRGRIDDLYLDFGKSRPAATTHDLADAIAATLAGKPVAQPVTKAVGCYIADLRP